MNIDQIVIFCFIAFFLFVLFFLDPKESGMDFRYPFRRKKKREKNWTVF